MSELDAFSMFIGLVMGCMVGIVAMFAVDAWGD